MVSGFVPLPVNPACPGGVMQDMAAFRFADGAQLWRHVCAAADTAEPPRTYWHMAPQPGASATLLRLPEPRDGVIAAGGEGLAEAVFDWDFGVLRAYAFHDGRSDCGIFRAWAYTDNGWQLIERREMPLCLGLEPADWIRTHTAPTTAPDPAPADG